MSREDSYRIYLQDLEKREAQYRKQYHPHFLRTLKRVLWKNPAFLDVFDGKNPNECDIYLEAIEKMTYLQLARSKLCQDKRQTVPFRQVQIHALDPFTKSIRKYAPYVASHFQTDVVSIAQETACILNAREYFHRK